MRRHASASLSLIAVLLLLPACVLANGTYPARGNPEGRAGRLYRLARRLQRQEIRHHRREIRAVSSFIDKGDLPADWSDGTEARPPHGYSTNILLRALELDPAHIPSRCSLVLNLLDDAYQGEGTWDAEAIQSVLTHLDRIHTSVQAGPVMRVGRNARRRLGLRLEHLWAAPPPALEQWWATHRETWLAKPRRASR